MADAPIGSETGVTVGFVLTVVGALATVVVWFLALLQQYVRRDVLDVTLRSMEEKLESLEREVIELRKEMRHER